MTSLCRFRGYWNLPYYSSLIPVRRPLGTVAAQYMPVLMNELIPTLRWTESSNETERSHRLGPMTNGLFAGLCVLPLVSPIKFRPFL